MKNAGREARPLALDNRVVDDAGSRTIADLLAAARTRLQGVPAEHPIVVISSLSRTLVGAAAWLAEGGRDGLLLERGRWNEAMRDRLVREGFAVVDADTGDVLAPGAGNARPGRIRLLTSGTTGEPKLVPHTWATLFTMARWKDPRPARWLLTYLPGTYAWYQLVTAALFLRGQDLVVVEGSDPATVLARAADAGVAAISATPTFWRMALLQVDPAILARLRGTLGQVTLGGEVIDQAILDRLARTFPLSRLVHIYASTEAGAAIVVADGLEGFPAVWLDDATREPRLSLRDGRLWIASRHAASELPEWLDTGDLAEIRGSRVVILGRADQGTINVGGAKALTADIERVLLAHPAVRWGRVRGVRAPLVGSLVAADVVLAPGEGPGGEPERWLDAWCRERLPEYMVPRLWHVLERVPVGANWKSEVL